MKSMKKVFIIGFFLFFCVKSSIKCSIIQFHHNNIWTEIFKQLCKLDRDPLTRLQIIKRVNSDFYNGVYDFLARVAYQLKELIETGIDLTRKVKEPNNFPTGELFIELLQRTNAAIIPLRVLNPVLLHIKRRKENVLKVHSYMCFFSEKLNMNTEDLAERLGLNRYCEAFLYID